MVRQTHIRTMPAAGFTDLHAWLLVKKPATILDKACVAVIG